MRNQKRRKIIAAAAVILAVVMVLSLALAAVRAEEAVSSETAVTEGVSAAAEEQTVAEEQTDMEALSSAGEKSGDDSPVITTPKKMPESRAVYIDNIDVTNMSLSQAEKAVADHMEKLKKDTIVLEADSRTAVTTAGALGLDYANKGVVSEALSIGKKGNVLKRFRAEREIVQDGPVVLDLDLTVDSASVTDVIREKEAEINCAPEPNGLQMDENRESFTVSERKSGVQVNEAAAIETVLSYMNYDWHGGKGEIVLPAELTEAEDTSAQLDKVRNLLGSGETIFDSTNEGRVTNISLATENINGTVIYPGEEFSSVTAIGPTTEEYGFKPGASYADGRIVETYGGGVCQVTSTLYRAVLEAELEVTERHNHTMLIHYAEPGLDATMSDQDLDFRFVNNTESPLYIEGIVEGDSVAFHIYGEETRDPGRTITFESREITKSDYETVYLMDENEDFGTVQEIYGEEGIQAELWKIITKDGEFESEEKINSSLYSPLNHAYIVGTKGASDATVTAIYNACAAESLGLIYDAIGTGTMATAVEVPED